MRSRLARSLSSNAIVSLAIPIIAIALPQIANADGDDRYVDRTLASSFAKTNFAPSHEIDCAIVAAALMGSPNDGFAPNINAIVQNVETDLDTFAVGQPARKRSIGWNVVDQPRTQVSGTPALRFHALGFLQRIGKRNGPFSTAAK